MELVYFVSYSVYGIMWVGILKFRENTTQNNNK